MNKSIHDLNEQNVLLFLLDCITDKEIIDTNYSQKELFDIYKQYVRQELKEFGIDFDLSSKKLDPEMTFFMCDENDRVPFSISDIDILLQTKINPFNNKNISPQGQEILKIIKKIYTKYSFEKWGGLLAELVNIEGTLSEDQADNIEKLKQKIIEIENANTVEEVCKLVGYFEKNKEKLHYLNSPVLDDLYNYCYEEKDNKIVKTDVAIKILIEKGLNISLSTLIQQYQYYIVKYLLQIHTYENEEIVKALEETVFLKSLKMFEIILENIQVTEGILNSIIVIEDTVPPLEFVKVLVEKYGADIHIEDEEPLKAASNNGFSDIVKYLIKKGADINTDGGFALGAAANHGDYELAKWLLEHGAHANIANADGTTPLMMMFLPFRNALADTRIIELLIRYGVNIRAEDDYALKYACLFGEYESVQILLRNGANVHAENEQPLFYAATKGYENIVRLLLSRGARADADIIRQAKTDKIRNIIRQHILRPPPIRDVHNTPPVQGIPMRPIRDMRPEALFLNNEL